MRKKGVKPYKTASHDNLTEPQLFFYKALKVPITAASLLLNRTVGTAREKRFAVKGMFKVLE
ncbi:MAG: hypothetical protein CSA81_00700 [Acidobacteria bacterium]|nr:MAG: hypothetical protein CSA81_00700 [Acidobacteriota bacterium]